MENNEIIRYEGGILKRVGNAISVTNKLLALAEPQLIPYRKGNKWGYCTPHKKIVIDCVFDEADIFCEGLAKVGISNRYGFIDKYGHQIYPIENLYASRFSEGLAKIGIGKYTFIDKKGNRINEKYTFDYCKDFKDGLSIVVWRGLCGIIDRNADAIFPFEGYQYQPFLSINKDLIAVSKNRKIGFIDRKDNVIIPLIYNDNKSLLGFKSAFSEGLSCLSLRGKLGFIDKLGNTLISFSYEDAMPFSNGLAYVKKNGKWGYIDNQQNIIIPFIHKSFGCNNLFSEELAEVEVNGKWGFINKQGSLMIQNVFDSVHSFSEGLACVTVSNKYGFIDKEGKIVIPIIYKYAESFSNGLAKVNNDGYINKEGIEYWDD